MCCCCYYFTVRFGRLRSTNGRASTCRYSRRSATIRPINSGNTRMLLVYLDIYLHGLHLRAGTHTRTMQSTKHSTAASTCSQPIVIMSKFCVLYVLTCAKRVVCMVRYLYTQGAHVLTTHYFKHVCCCVVVPQNAFSTYIYTHMVHT